VEVHEVLTGPARGGLALPAALDPAFTFWVGRGCELDFLLEGWRRAGRGQSRGTLVGGDAGIGKTRLAAQLAAHVHEDGGIVLYGDCDEIVCDEDGSDAYGPFVEALRDLVSSRSADQLEAVPGIAGLLPLSRDLGRRLSGLPGPPEQDPAAARHLIGEGLVGLLASLESRVLMVFDDLQWATVSTLLLMRHLLRTGERLPLFVVGTYRDSEVDRDHPLWEAMATVRKEGRVDRLDLVGLDEPASVAFVAAAAGHELDQRSTDFARLLHDRTAGNPFFMQEILNHLTEAGTIYQTGGRWTADPGMTVDDLTLPDSVRAVIGRRLAHLSETTRHLLRVGSVAGRIFSLELLEEVVGVSGPPDDVLRAVDEALEAGVLVEPGPGQLTFAHALYRQELAAELSDEARVELHDAIDKALKVLPTVRFGS
jgi:predicted ATPase